MIELIHGDCLEEMKKIPDGSVDLVLTDPPYGTTACKWDTIIPLEPMWEQLKRVIKPNGAIVMTASQPFTTTLISSNMKMFRYEWIWQKEQGIGFANANKMPMKDHENVCVWYKKLPTYNPQNLMPCEIKKNRKATDVGEYMGNNGVANTAYTQKWTNYPKTVQKFSRPDKGRFHPTQKPVALMEYLIKTYTNEGETVLDFTMGSGTTGVACKNLNRNFIGIELDKDYFEIAKNRINNTVYNSQN